MSKTLINRLSEISSTSRILVDSGAFTAWKLGKSINLDDYCKFLEDLPFTPWRYFTLDVVGDPDASFKNYEKMMIRGFSPIPIFTRGDKAEMIDEYYKTTDILGVGGLVGTKGSKGYVNGFMSKVAGRKTHWLGFVDENYVKHYKPYMCDSSTWMFGTAAFGRMKIYIGNGRFSEVNKGERYESWYLKKTFRGYSISPDGIEKDSWWSGSFSKSRMMAGESIVRWMLDLEKQTGTKQFAAGGSRHDLEILNKGYELWKH